MTNNLLYSSKLQRKWGWKPSLPDHRDHKFSTRRLSETDFPEIIDLSEYLPPVFNQKTEGCCVTCGSTEAFRAERNKAKLADFDMSHNQLYYDLRVMEGTVDSDSGAMIRDAVKSLASTGVAHENLWSFTPDNMYEKPTDNVYEDAANYKISTFASVDVNPASIMEALNNGHPVIIGTSVFASFESDEVAETGIIPMPEPNEKVLGGHCTCVFGYDKTKRLFHVRNSWGVEWGEEGNFWAPFDYIGSEQFGSDYWVITGLNSK